MKNAINKVARNSTRFFCAFLLNVLIKKNYQKVLRSDLNIKKCQIIKMYLGVVFGGMNYLFLSHLSVDFG